ncbi:MAG TPA: LD-carboxypeptidase [Casimicrobium sp.]|nr:LD-carboxypeptidase [Casimicrobium sp.]
MPLLPHTPSPSARIALLSLSGAVVPERLGAGIERLHALGYTTIGAEAAAAQWRYFAGTDDARLAALNAALDSDAKIVMFTRGGYGISRLLHRIDWARVAASGKVFCGFSDVTAFSLAALAQVNYVTLSGPMAAAEFAQADQPDARDFTEAQFRAFLQTAGGYRYPQCTSDVLESDRTIEGTLWGTNLCVLTHLIGTPYMPQVDNGILVLEDVGEAPYRVERMFWQLKHAGILDRQRAIILGAFTDCGAPAGMRYPYSMTEAIETLREIAPCPVLTGFPFGHIPSKVTLPIGAPARLEMSGTNYTLSVSNYLR